MTPIATCTVVIGALVTHSFVLAFSERGPLFWIARLFARSRSGGGR